MPDALLFLLGARPPEARQLFIFFNDRATTEIYALSLHDALPISPPAWRRADRAVHLTSTTMVCTLQVSKQETPHPSASASTSSCPITPWQCLTAWRPK